MGRALKDKTQILRALEFSLQIGVDRVPLGMERDLNRLFRETGASNTKLDVSLKEAESCESDKLKANQKKLYELRARIGNCQRCRLAAERTNIVFGSGHPCAELMFIGEGPGRDEDLKGLPFVGAAGELLTKIINAMQFTRDEVYIANIVKCRPPHNRDPEPDEVDTCMGFLTSQIEIIQPRALILLGRVAAQSLLRTSASITSLRGTFQDYKGIPAMVTYHPAYLLRNPKAKKTVWEDVQKVMKIFGKEPKS